MYDLIIIGSGPAGMAAAIYAQRARLDMVVLETQPMGGGQILTTYEIDNYPGIPASGGFELGMQMRQHAESTGARFVQTSVTAIENRDACKLVKTTEGDYETKAVLIASGAVHRKLGVTGEEALSGMGVSYCATCDGAFFRNKITAVVGGGNVALEDALFLARNCSLVYVIHRRDELRGEKILQEQIKKAENIKVLYSCEVREIVGDGAVNGVVLYQKKKDKTMKLDVNGVFIAVGIQPNVSFVGDLVEQDETGYIVAREDGITSCPGIFVAGDVRTKQLRQVITAAADGANAVKSIEQYLNTQ